MVAVDISKVDVDVIKSGRMLLVDFLVSVFRLVVVVCGRVVLRGFRVDACRISPLTVVPTVVDVDVDISGVELTNARLVDIVVVIVVEPLSEFVVI